MGEWLLWGSGRCGEWSLWGSGRCGGVVVVGEWSLWGVVVVGEWSLWGSGRQECGSCGEWQVDTHRLCYYFECICADEFYEI